MRSVFVTITLLFMMSSSFADVIKQSRSGICHPPASKYYDKTKHFTAFDTLEECLDSGGRLPKGLKTNISDMDKAISEANAENRPFALVYNRNDWSHWDDTNNSGCDARDDALIAQADGPLSFKSNSRCDVVAGTWYLPYSGKTFTGKSSQVDADHVVPLSYAFQHQGASWSKELKQQFANDPENIIIVSAKYNRQKSDSGPSEWMPPLQSYRCEYLSRFDAVMRKYGLVHTSGELRVLKKMHAACKLPAPFAA